MPTIAQNDDPDNKSPVIKMTPMEIAMIKNLQLRRQLCFQTKANADLELKVISMEEEKLIHEIRIAHGLSARQFVSIDMETGQIQSSSNP